MIIKLCLLFTPNTKHNQGFSPQKAALHKKGRPFLRTYLNRMIGRYTDDKLGLVWTIWEKS